MILTAVEHRFEMLRNMVSRFEGYFFSWESIALLLGIQSRMKDVNEVSLLLEEVDSTWIFMTFRRGPFAAEREKC